MRKFTADAIQDFVIVVFGIICLALMLGCLAYFDQHATPQDKEDVTIIWFLMQS